MRVVLSLFLAVSCLLPAFASNPGEPLDCSDWVFLDEGFSCAPFTPLDGLPPFSALRRGKGVNAATDNLGRLLTLRFTYVENFAGAERTLARLEVVRNNGLTEEVIAYVEDRLTAGVRDQVRPVWYWDWNIARGKDSPHHGFPTEPFVFDSANGSLRIVLWDYCTDCANAYEPAFWIASINGFTTLLEIFHSYEPSTNEISYRVPYMPEGFAGASYFDTYYGPLTNPIEFGKAQPLRCGYPASPPSAGDYLTVADPLPDPPVNTGRYYITAVNHMGQRRYGRQNSGGVLSGRNPGVLPLCAD